MGPRKSLIHKHLQQKYILLNFFLYKVQKLAYYVYMKVREIKIRKTILFTKARPFKLKNKILDRKTKHKKQYEY